LILKNPAGGDGKTELSKTRATLVVAPLALIRQWESEIRKKTKLTCAVHHGPGRTKDPKELSGRDVVVTTYQVLVAEHAKLLGVFGLHYHRIILDEAHSIKNKSSKSSIAACSLQATHRWCLTGTPLQNHLDELYSLFRFLRVSPLDRPEEFRDKISQPIRRGRAAVAIKRLQAVLSVIMLRRTKEVLASSVALPERKLNRVDIELSAEERAFYTNLEGNFSKTLNGLIKNNEVGKNYTNVLVMLLRLRQACDHPHLVNDEYRATKDDMGNTDDMDALADLMNGLTVDKTCKICMVRLLSGSTCQSCEIEIDRTSKLTRSAKIDQLLKILAQESRKTIVFSQFTSMLDKIAPFLKAADIPVSKYYGSMRNEAREASLRSLASGNTMVLLCSLKCGALGLNLVAASRVVLLDPWWNPQISEQAIDRVRRLGQLAPVVDVFEFCVRASVEERIFTLQEKKRKLAQTTLDGGKPRAYANNKLTLTDLMFLFNRQAEEQDE
jgi:SNF2 family DNA or RNA helicase